MPSSGRDQSLLVAVNRAAAFNVAARWVLHDLRSPAQSLTLMADLMADPPEDLEEILRDACGSLARSLDLLSRVLRPPSTGGIGSISVRESIAFVTDLQRVGRTHVLVKVAVDPGLPPAAGSGQHLEHALLNLVLYATDALRPRETGVIRITAGPADDQVRILLSWDGPPVPAELETRLFQLPPGVSPAEQPLASGLFVAREVLRLSGGTLGYSRDAGPGPCFVLTLSRWRPAAPAR